MSKQYIIVRTGEVIAIEDRAWRRNEEPVKEFADYLKWKAGGETAIW